MRNLVKILLPDRLDTDSQKRYFSSVNQPISNNLDLKTPLRCQLISWEHVTLSWKVVIGK